MNTSAFSAIRNQPLRKVGMAVLFFALLPAGVAAQPELVLRGANIVDVVAGVIHEDMDIAIEDGRISMIVATADSAYPGAASFDVRNTFVIPGLWDVHVHLSYAGASSLPVLLAYGVTNVRDVGSDLAEIDGWRSGINNGSRIGPSIMRAGPMVNGESFNEFQLATGSPEQAREIVSALKQVGVDFIKIHRRTSRDTFFAIMDEASAQALTVAGHVPMDVSPLEASRAGLFFEHAITLFEGTFSEGEDPLVLASEIEAFLATPEAQTLFAELAANETPLTPTLDAMRALFDYDALVTDPAFRYMTRSSREALLENRPLPEAAIPAIQRLDAQLQATTGRLHQAGVRLLAGTDLSTLAIPGLSLHQELQSLVNSGLSPLEAIRSATLNPAIVHGMRANLGAVEAGQVANLVMLGNNPLDDIAHTREIGAVVVAGKLFTRSDLDALLEQGASLADSL